MKLRMMTAMVATGAALAATATSATAAPADLVCDGVVANASVANLIVPAGANCQFTSGTVNGQIQQAAGSQAWISGSRVLGATTSAGSLTIEARSNTGAITTSNFLSVANSTTGAITANGSSATDVRLQGGANAASVTLTNGSLRVLSAKVRGNVTAHHDGTGSLTAQGSTIQGALTSTNGSFSSLCATTVNGAANFASTGTLVIGDNPAPQGPACSGATFNRSLTVTGSGVAVVKTTVRGIAAGYRSTWVNLSNNTFSGGARGDFAK